ncbi:MAG: hypothetical protein Q9212_005625 [Teloschistes hypoglaucus]
MDKKAGIGELSCKDFVANSDVLLADKRFTDLSAGVDVYSDWIDACDSVAKETVDATGEDDGLNHYQDHNTLVGSGRRHELEPGHTLSMADQDKDDDMEGYSVDDD